MASGYFFLMHFYFFLMRAGYFFLMHLYFFFDTCLMGYECLQERHMGITDNKHGQRRAKNNTPTCCTPSASVVMNSNSLVPHATWKQSQGWSGFPGRSSLHFRDLFAAFHPGFVENIGNLPETSWISRSQFFHSNREILCP